MSDEKWPGQSKAQPFGYPPRGMWYDPEVKESAAKGLSLNDAIKFFLHHPDLIGRPGFVELSDRTVEFDNGKVINFDDLMKLYVKYLTQKESSGGFYDSPTDLGKDPKGDFPSVMWLPRGHEDEEADPNVVTSDLALSKLHKKALETELPIAQKEQIAAKWGAEYNSAIQYYNTAVANGHPKDRAIEYAVSEMGKKNVKISPSTLLEITNTYLPRR